MHTRLSATLLSALMLVASTSSTWAQTAPTPQSAPAAVVASPQPTVKIAEPAPAPATVVPKPSPSPTAAPAEPTPTKVAAATTTQATPATPVAAATAAPTAPSPAVAPAVTAVASPVANTTAAPKPRSYLFHARVFEDSDGDRAYTEEDDALAPGVLVQIGDGRQALTDEHGEFRFDALLPGRYELKVLFPEGLRLEDEDGYRQWVEITDHDIKLDLLLSHAPVMIGEGVEGIVGQAVAATEEQEGEQIAAMVGGNLQLRFAPGRDTLAQVSKRALADKGVVWLGVPFITQMDGTLFQSVNCGPASLAMVLAAFGLDVGAGQVRDYLNSLIHNYDVDAGTSLDVLAKIGREAGLQPLDLYSDRGGYRRWTVDAVRWHVEQGHPVITLVKYRDLPGHSGSLFQSDHYVVITGLTPTGFIYNDAAFSTTLGYGLEISNEELQVAWDNSSIPRHASAMTLNGAAGQLSFPELPEVAAPASIVPDEPSAWWLGRLSLFGAPAAAPAPTPKALADLIAQDEAAAGPATSEYGLEIQERTGRMPSGLPDAGNMAGRLLIGLGGLWLLVSAWSIVAGAIRLWRRAPALLAASRTLPSRVGALLSVRRAPAWMRALTAALLQVLR